MKRKRPKRVAEPSVFDYQAAIAEAVILTAVGAFALADARLYPSLGVRGVPPAYGTLVIGLLTVAAALRRQTSWFATARPLRIPGGLACAFLQLILEGRRSGWSFGPAAGLAVFLGFLLCCCCAVVCFFVMAPPLLELLGFPLSRGALPRPNPLPVLLDFDTRDAEAGPERAAEPELGGRAEVLVEEGGFRVDAARAAEKLRDFQLPDAERFLVPLLRCAVASGAARIAVDTKPDGLVLSFDGEAFPPAVLRDPYCGLLGSEGGEPARQLAVGLLALLRLAPTAVEIVSGRGAGRRRLRAPAAARGGEAPMEPGEDTVLRASWAGGSAVPAAAAAKLREAFGLCAAELRIDGEAVPDPARAAEPLAKWDEAGSHGVALAGKSLLGGRKIGFYKLGALVQQVPEGDRAAAVTWFVRDDAFSLDLSQTKVVKDARRDRAWARLGKLGRTVSKNLGTPERIEAQARLARKASAAFVAVLAALLAYECWWFFK